MLEIAGRARAASPPPPIEFVTIQLMPLSDGTTSVSLKSTIFDDSDYQLVDQDIASERVSTLDDLLAVIRSHVRVAASTH